ncbi:MAG: two-component regulator propeller domain-containing protein [Chloroflexota bacterium]
MKNVFLFIVLGVFLINAGSVDAAGWVKAKGPYGGNISSIVTLDNNVVLASTTSDMPGTFPAFGVIKSTDGGATWTDPPQNMLTGVATAVLYKLKDGNVLCSADGLGLLKSTDKGETWSSLCSAIGSFSGLVEASNGNLLCFDWFSTKLSTDSGNTFNKITELGGSWGIKVDSKGAMFALSNKKGVWKSANNGVTWEDVSGSTLLEKDCRAICIDKDDNIWVSTWNSFFFSSDGGGTWTKRDEGLNAYAVSPKGSSIVQDTITGRMYICFSITGGIMTYDESLSKWVKFSSAMPQQSVEAIAFTPQGRMLVGDRSVGIGYSDDNGVTWNLPNLKVGEKMIYELAVHGEELYVGTGDGMVYKLVDEHGDFTPILFPPLTPQAFVMGLTVTNQGTILVGRSGAGFSRSADNGATWTELYSTAKILPETFLVDGDKIYAGSRGSGPRGVAVSLDDGQTWTNETDAVAGKDIFSLTKNKKGDIFAGSGRQGLFVKPVETGIWTKTSFPDTLFIYGIVFDSGGDLFVGTADGYIYKSTDNGSTFNVLASNRKVQAMTIVDSENSSYKDDIFIAADNKCAMIEHNFDEINDFSEGFEGVYPRAILYHPDHRRLYIGGMTGGLQWYDLTVISADDPKVTVDEVSVYPNPARDFISLSGFAAAAGERLEIFSPQGVKVLEIASSNGNIDVSRLPAGIYFIRSGGRAGKFVKINY